MASVESCPTCGFWCRKDEDGVYKAVPHQVIERLEEELATTKEKAEQLASDVEDEEFEKNAAEDEVGRLRSVIMGLRDRNADLEKEVKMHGGFMG